MEIRPSTFQKKVLEWFSVHGRKNLPWQKNPTPYRVWLSEIMLQQTQVATVIPYFEKWTQRFPTMSAFGKADLETILSLWAGLGYYARARNLHKTAQIIMKEYRGRFPKTFEQIIQLPGIGRSTAGAILSLALKQPYPILDANVKRVLSRFFAIAKSNETDYLDLLWTLATKFTPKTHVAEYTQAMMDLGATLCTRTQANCTGCPLQKRCKAYQTNTVSNYPAQKKQIKKPLKKTMFAIFKCERHILLEQRPTTGIWGGLWSFLEFDATSDLPQAYPTRLMPTFKHTFTHFHLEITPVLIELTSKKLSLPDLRVKTTNWFNLNDPNMLPGMPAPTQKLVQQLTTYPISNS